MQESADDIIDVIKRLRADDSDAELIGRRGRDFVLQHLHRRARWCYWREVLVRAGDGGQKMERRERRGEEWDVETSPYLQLFITEQVGRLMSAEGGVALIRAGRWRAGEEGSF